MPVIKPMPGTPQDRYLSCDADIAGLGGGAGRGLSMYGGGTGKVNLDVMRIMPIMNSVELSRYRARIVPVESGCHEWQAAKKDGYGVVGLLRDGKRKTFYAHRIAYFLHHRVDPQGLFVCHSCDNPGCCNPDHLWLGTNKDNVHDSIKKKRNSPPPYMGGWNKKPLSQDVLDRLGKEPDYLIARSLGCDKSVIQDRRKELGIKSYAELTGNNGQFKGGARSG